MLLGHRYGISIGPSVDLRDPRQDFGKHGEGVAMTGTKLVQVLCVVTLYAGDVLNALPQLRV